MILVPSEAVMRINGRLFHRKPREILNLNRTRQKSGLRPIITVVTYV